MKLNRISVLGLFLALSIPFFSFSQTDTSDKKYEDMGVAVSPSSMHLGIKPGTTVTKEITIFNDTKKTNKFQIAFSDFEMGRNGKPTSMKAGEGKYALSRWINLVPSYVELKPQEKKKIKLVITIPDEPDAYKAAWTIVTIDQVVDRPPLAVTNNGNTLAMGILPSIGFGVYVYQNPPNVKINSVEIQKFALVETEGKKTLEMIAKNTGDGIGYCTTYAEITNINTGKKTKLNDKRFTILPQYFRDFSFDLPSDLPKGKYSAVGVLDFGSKEDIVVAEIEFVIQ